VDSTPPDQACVVHHGMDELLVEQHAVPDGQSTPVEEGAKQAQYLSRLLPYLVGVSRPGKPCVKGYPQGTVLFRPSPKSCGGLGLWTHLVVLAKSNAVLFETLIAILQSRSQSSSLLRYFSGYLTRTSGLRHVAMSRHPRTALTRRAVRAWACRSHTD
jgi:hypothetical protein